MTYNTIYDLSAQPALNWRTLVLPLVLAVTASAVASFVRQGTGRYGLFGFALIAVFVSVVIPCWDRYQLLRQEPKVVEGLIKSHWEKEWIKRANGKKQRYSYESFQVDAIPFGYFRNVVMAGFHNGELARFPITDGLPVRIYYVPERQIDGGNVFNRIVKLEIAKAEYVRTID